MACCCFSSNTDQPKVLVIGLQGAGKSLLLQQLVQAAARQTKTRGHGCLLQGARSLLRSAAVSPLPENSKGLPGSSAAARTTMPTIGTELQKFPSLGFTTREVGGAMLQLYHHYYSEAAAVVFVVNAACPDPAAAAAAAAAKGWSTEAAAKQQGAAAAVKEEETLCESLCEQQQADAAVGVTLCTAHESSKQIADHTAAASDTKTGAGVQLQSSSCPTATLATKAAETDTEAAAAETAAAAASGGVEQGAAVAGLPAAPTIGGQVAAEEAAAATAAAATAAAPPVRALPASRRPAPSLAQVLQELLAHPALQAKPVCIVLNKQDLLPSQQPQQQQQEQQQSIAAGPAQQQQGVAHDLTAQQQQQQQKGEGSGREQDRGGHRQFTVLETSALTAAGVHSLLQWMESACNTRR